MMGACQELHRRDRRCAPTSAGSRPPRRRRDRAARRPGAAPPALGGDAGNGDVDRRARGPRARCDRPARRDGRRRAGPRPGRRHLARPRAPRRRPAAHPGRSWASTSTSPPRRSTWSGPSTRGTSWRSPARSSWSWSCGGAGSAAARTSPCSRWRPGAGRTGAPRSECGRGRFRGARTASPRTRPCVLTPGSASPPCRVRRRARQLQRPAGARGAGLDGPPPPTRNPCRGRGRLARSLAVVRRRALVDRLLVGRHQAGDGERLEPVDELAQLLGGAAGARGTAATPWCATISESSSATCRPCSAYTSATASAASGEMPMPGQSAGDVDVAVAGDRREQREVAGRCRTAWPWRGSGRRTSRSPTA